jgi:hypothetical protein
MRSSDNAMRYYPALKDDSEYKDTFTWSNGIFYKKGYNAATKTGTICAECYGALIKDKIPICSVANNMWIGDVPPALQGLTYAEEKL